MCTTFSMYKYEPVISLQTLCLHRSQVVHQFELKQCALQMPQYATMLHHRNTLAYEYIFVIIIFVKIKFRLSAINSKSWNSYNNEDWKYVLLCVLWEMDTKIVIINFRLNLYVKINRKTEQLSNEWLEQRWIK